MLEKRNELEEMYRTILGSIPFIEFQYILEDRQKIAWLVTVLVPEHMREICMKELKRAGIDVRPFFIPLSEMEIYREYVFQTKTAWSYQNKDSACPHHWI